MQLIRRILLNYILSGLVMSAVLLSARYVVFSPLGPMNVFEVGVCVFCGMLLGYESHGFMRVLFGRRIITPAYATQMILYGLLLRWTVAINRVAPRPLDGHEFRTTHVGLTAAYLLIAAGILIILHTVLTSEESSGRESQARPSQLAAEA